MKTEYIAFNIWLLLMFVLWVRVHVCKVYFDKAIEILRKKCWDAAHNMEEYRAYFAYMDNIDYIGMIWDVRKWTFKQFFPDLVTITGHEKKSEQGRWPWVVKSFLLFAILLLPSCTETSPGAQDVSGSLGGAEVKLITLQDGTKCAVLIGYQKAGISCNWK